MQLRDWQAQNFQTMVRSYVPEEHHDLFIMSSARIFEDMPLNPWLDFFEVLALAWRAGFVAKEDVQTFRVNLEWKTLPIPSDRDLRKKGRPLLKLLLDLFEDKHHSQPYSEHPLVEFGLFLDMHSYFRRNLTKILFALDYQVHLTSLVRKEDHETIVRQLLESEQSYFRWDREALAGLLFLLTYLSQVTLMFSRWPFFVRDLKELYQMWVRHLENQTIDLGIALVGDIGESGSPDAASQALRRSKALKVMLGHVSLDELSNLLDVDR